MPAYKTARNIPFKSRYLLRDRKSYEKHLHINITDKSQVLHAFSEGKEDKGHPSTTHSFLPPHSWLDLEQKTWASEVELQKIKDFIVPIARNNPEPKEDHSMAEPLLIIKQHWNKPGKWIYLVAIWLPGGRECNIYLSFVNLCTMFHLVTG